MRVRDRRIRVGGRACVRIRNRDPTVRFATFHPRFVFFRRVFRFPEQARAVRVAVRPAIDGDAGDIAIGVEPGACQRLVQLVLDVVLESRERRLQQSSATGPPLLRPLLLLRPRLLLRLQLLPPSSAPA